MKLFLLRLITLGVFLIENIKSLQSALGLRDEDSVCISADTSKSPFSQNEGDELVNYIFPAVGVEGFLEKVQSHCKYFSRFSLKLKIDNHLYFRNMFHAKNKTIIMCSSIGKFVHCILKVIHILKYWILVFL